MITLTINDEQHSLDLPEQMPLLWALRDVVALTGTRFGCGMGLCGACTVHLDGVAVRSCVTPLSAAVDKQVTTIEAMATDPVGREVQKAWLDAGVAQCGYCQAGQIMSATALLKDNASPSDDEIISAMGGNICRCGTYNRIRTAIHRAADSGSPQQAAQASRNERGQA
ncbi:MULTISPECIES: (2Fe-2S)-binding protein [unclassified Halomonas]|uniref:(2Fe-2S)-binding protein n=1 Tax=unclassified Halomonas TaxID=2609666 RepID=UPI001C95FB88|nr:MULTISPECIES: (2Fe-2S)-binding protein [unclassified Halomonas]MBY5924146.1 (2Fe-2S)-binding protein [Halomonas sp. DP4Y7-2]MBY6231188.1 (2Fe-2S)-binding protein [Halomonas sp. DP4Y7-1]